MQAQRPAPQWPTSFPDLFDSFDRREWTKYGVKKKGGYRPVELEKKGEKPVFDFESRPDPKAIIYRGGYEIRPFG